MLARELHMLDANGLLKESYPNWRCDVRDAEEAFVENPEDGTLFESHMLKIRVKALNRDEKFKRVLELSVKLINDKVDILKFELKK